MPEFIRRFSTPESLLSSERSEVVDLIAPLGFKNRRTERLYKLAEGYLTQKWSDPRDLPGIGEYGARSWEIFCRNIIGEQEPDDGALKVYWKWRTCDRR